MNWQVGNSGSAPLIVRIGGLPASTMTALASDLIDQAAVLDQLGQNIHELRAVMVERLHRAIEGCEPRDLRRFLLAVKRDCFNGRQLAKQRENPRWAQLQKLAGAVGDRLADMESEFEEARVRFADRYHAEEELQRQWVVQQFEDPSLRRGLALASLDLYRTKRVLDKTPAERRQALALLRYISRAALKLSPFSTFTRIALAETRLDGRGLTLLSCPWREGSLLRLKRNVLDQLTEMLGRYPSIRKFLRIALNDSLTEIGDRRFLFVRPSLWFFDEGRGVLRYALDSLVKADLKGPLFAVLRETLAAGPMLYENLSHDLVHALGREFEAAAVEREIEKLLGLGVLHLLWPWPNDEGYLEQRMLRDLQCLLPLDPRLAAFLVPLERLIKLEEGYRDAEDPGGSLDEIENLVAKLWREAAVLGGLPLDTRRSDPTRFKLHEDVFLTSNGVADARAPSVVEPSAIPSIATLADTSARSALADVEPFVRLATLYDHRHEFRKTIGVFISERWPGRRQIGLLELFDAARPLWRDYWRFYMETRKEGTWRSSLFNPLGLPQLEELRSLRKGIWEDVEACLENDEENGETFVRATTLASVVNRVPRHYTLAAGACLLLQQADAAAGLWVLNRLKEGTGRYGSRYTPAMDAATRRIYTRHLQERAWVEQDGEQLEVVDILCTQGDNLNVHAPLTRRLLALPGAMGSVNAGCHLSLGDLLVELDAQDWPWLTDAVGQRLLPVHLGLAFSDFMPTLFRFLGLFGPSELSAVFPHPRVIERNGVRIRYRLRIGDVVLRRRAWSIPALEWAASTIGLVDAEAFRVLNGLRKRHYIPERVFCSESVVSTVLRTRRLRPQYLDLSSPLFLNLFRTVLEDHDADYLDLVEMLPTPDACPPDACGERWAVELMVDESALRAVHSSSEDLGTSEPEDAVNPLLQVGGSPWSSRK